MLNHLLKNKYLYELIHIYISVIEKKNIEIEIAKKLTLTTTSTNRRGDTEQTKLFSIRLNEVVAASQLARMTTTSNSC